MPSLYPFLFFFIFVFSQISQAAEPPVPKRKSEALYVFKERLLQEGQQKTKLERKLKRINKDVEKTRSELVNVAGAIQDNESELQRLQSRIARLEEKKEETERKLWRDRASIARLIVALERIRRVPPEVLIARPQTPYKNAQSAMLMRSVIPVMNRHAETLRVNLETLKNVANDLEEERKTSYYISQDLSIRQKKLSDLLNKRKVLYSQTNIDFNAHEAQMQRISLQAKTLEELVLKLKKKPIVQKHEPRNTFSRPPDPNVQSVVVLEKPKHGQPQTKHRMMYRKSGKPPQLPISGILRTRYNQRDHIGAPSNGLSIEGRPGALVVTPISGKIQFSGAFKRYGNMIIIEHADGFHSLIAGLGKLNVVVGQAVISGEPLGTMPNSSLAVRPKLYYELRLNGQPVNPALKFSDLG